MWISLYANAFSFLFYFHVDFAGVTGNIENVATFGVVKRLAFTISDESADAEVHAFNAIAVKLKEELKNGMAIVAKNVKINSQKQLQMIASTEVILDQGHPEAVRVLGHEWSLSLSLFFIFFIFFSAPAKQTNNKLA